MKSKKGFTLVELLAVIVILAIIALIATPQVLKMIEETKRKSVKASLNGLVDSANMYYNKIQLANNLKNAVVFDFENGKQTSKEKLEYKGRIYNGKLILHTDSKVAACIDDGKYYAYKNKDSDEIVEGSGKCEYDGSTGDFEIITAVDELKKEIAKATATKEDVLSGKTIYTKNGLVTGTMKNNSGNKISATKIEEENTNALITIPEAGYYDTNSKISIPITSIKSNVTSLKDILNHTNINGQNVAIYFEKNLDTTFLPKINSISMNTGDQVNNTFNVKPTISYNKSTGLLSYSNTYHQYSALKYSFNIDVIQATKAIKIGTSNTSGGNINCTSLSNYKSLSKDNFILVLENLYYYTGYWQQVAMTITPTFTYNNQTGIITLGSLYTNAGEASAKVGNATATVSVYYIEQ